ncbi:PPC domain-containing DNA-binding protein [Hydrogenophaga sp.]|uniref:PPC domain-containing DNA-binding protein n=1 Tax=Hydrogenophaga sp. TaxID=1904254 RepID=UPI002FCB27BC
MRWKLISQDTERTYALVLAEGDEVVSTIEAFAREHKLTASRLSAIGALCQVGLGYFDWDKKDYLPIDFDEQLKVLSLLGDLALHEDAPKLHAHVVLGRRDGSTCGGHLMRATVRPTLEVLLVESPAHLRRAFDPASGLPLIHIES